MAIVKRVILVCLLLILVLVTWGVGVYHKATVMPPSTKNIKPSEKNRWYPFPERELNHIVLHGDHYSRGYYAGEKTQHLLRLQEQTLVSKLNSIFTVPSLRRVLEVFALRWFWGIERYFESWMLEEMKGVSQWAPKEFSYLGNSFNRQIYYHGLHEIGQMMVDQRGTDMGCTVVALPYKNSVLLGRNFDFEGGRIFDEEKLVKWVFPETGYAFVSVIWAGMVGAVTGVNEHGVYISMNAAGTDDRRRYGMPSTLVLLKALQFSKTAEEALKHITEAKVFISDIYVVADGRSSKVYRVEKSPKTTEVLESAKAHVITNHLVSKRWDQDPINSFRREELTSLEREERGNFLLNKLARKGFSTQPEKDVLEILRDKGEANGKPYALGHRGAIDPLIATHSVIYNGQEKTFFISKGPGVSGKFFGYDLDKSFKTHEPVLVATLPPDARVKPQVFKEVREAEKLLIGASNLAQNGLCREAEAKIDLAPRKDGYLFLSAKGDLHQCNGELDQAKKSWRAALALSPAYKRERQQLEGKLRQ